MKAIYKTPLRVVLNSLRHYQQIEAGIEETNGLNFFPENTVGTVGETTLYTLRFNPKVQTLLALYDLAMDGGIDTGEAIVRYSLFHAALEMDEYDQAQAHLDAFRRELAHLGLSALSEDEREEIRARVLMQLYFLLFHESFHFILHRDPDNRGMAFDTTRQLLLDIKAELEDGLSLVTEEELLNHPKTRRQIENMIPRELPEAERLEMEENLREMLAANPIRPDYIDRVLQHERSQVEEITCDRQAWLNLLPIFQGEGATAEDILQIHLCMFIVFNAMDFNKFLLSQFVPSLHGKTEYDGMRVVLRHKAFKTLLRQYSPEVYKLLKSEYLNLNNGLGAVYRSAVMMLYRHADDLARLYAKHEKGGSCPDFAEIMRLERELSEAADLLL